MATRRRVAILRRDPPSMSSREWLRNFKHHMSSRVDVLCGCSDYLLAGRVYICIYISTRPLILIEISSSIEDLQLLEIVRALVTPCNRDGAGRQLVLLERNANGVHCQEHSLIQACANIEIYTCIAAVCKFMIRVHYRLKLAVMHASCWPSPDVMTPLAVYIPLGAMPGTAMLTVCEMGPAEAPGS